MKIEITLPLKLIVWENLDYRNYQKHLLVQKL
jgi:hypothetical protein